MLKRLNYIVLFILGLSLYNPVLSQDACSTHEQMKLMTSNSYNKFAKTYWAKRCACETGNITSGTWDYSVEVMNRMYKLYQKPGFMDDYEGASFPIPNKLMKVTDCKSSFMDQDAGIATTACDEPAFTKEQDPQQYGNAFMTARCQCLEGVAYEEQAKNLAIAMEANYQNALTYYGAERLNLPAPLGWESCPIIDLGQDYTKDPGESSNRRIMLYTGNESTAEIMRDQYIEVFSSPNQFNAYTAGMNVKRLGESMVGDLVSNLNQIGTLISSTDPKLILEDFNQKVGEIENLEATFDEQFNSYSFETGQNIGNSINNKDYEGAVFEGLGYLNASLEKKEAEKRLQEQREALYQQRLHQMSQVYWKAVDYNLATRARFLQRAAFSEDLAEEKYNLAFVENLECHNTSMENSFSSSHTNWLKNNCPQPIKKQVIDLGSPKVSKDLYYQQLAERKFNVYVETAAQGQEVDQQYREAAIHFMAKSISLRPTASKYARLAEYYEGKSSILELSNFLTAIQYDKKSLTMDQLNRVEELKSMINNQIKSAIYSNDDSFVTSFLNSGMEEMFRPDNLDVLDFIISYDRSELIPGVLNYKTQNLGFDAKQNFFKRLVMFCIAHDSPRSLQTLMEAGISLDFELDGKQPIALMYETSAENCLTTYLTLSKSYKEVSHFYKGLAIFSTGDTQHGVINNKGEIVVPAKYQRIRSPKNGLIVCLNNENKYGALDYFGNEVIGFKYNYLGDISNGKILASLVDGAYGYIDRQGETLLPFEFEYAEDFGAKYAVVGRKKGNAFRFGVINEQGELIVQYLYQSTNNLNSDFLELKKYSSNGSEEIYYLFPDGKVYESESFNFSPFKYGRKFNERTSVRAINEKFTVVENAKKELVQVYHRDKLIFEADRNAYKAITVHNDLVRLKKADGACSLMDSLGDNLNLKSGFDYFPLENGLIAYKDLQSVNEINQVLPSLYIQVDGFLGLNGEEIKADELLSGQPLESALVIYKVFPDNLNLDNKYVVNSFNGEFSYYEDFRTSDYTALSKLGIIRRSGYSLEEGIWGYINSRGEWVIPPIYKALSSFEGNFGLVKTAEKELSIIDSKGRLIDKVECAENSIVQFRFRDGILYDKDGYYFDQNGRKIFNYLLSEAYVGFDSYLFEFDRGVFKVLPTRTNRELYLRWIQ